MTYVLPKQVLKKLHYSFLLNFIFITISVHSIKATEAHQQTKSSYALNNLLPRNPESLQFLRAHNAVRRAKSLPPLTWDNKLEKYARSWADERRSDCALIHSSPEDNFQVGENIFWGGGSGWSPNDAVRAWADEEKYYDYASNGCESGQMCGHYTQIVWRDTKRIGCARVVCDNGDVFVTCNYYPPGNYVGERPY